MADWKKIIVSGSDAELAKLNVEPNQQISSEANNTFLSGSFSGSFQGDGSGLSIYLTYSGSDGSGDIINLKDETITFSTQSSDGFSFTVDGATNTVKLVTPQGLETTDDVTFNTVNADGNLVVDGNTTLGDASGDSVTINAGTINAPNITAGTDDTVLVLTAGGEIRTDEIDTRVWGSTLVDGSGLSANYVTFASDSDTITGDGGFTYDSVTRILTAPNATITGDLIVQGTTTELQVTNLNIEDQFILLNSGSSGADTGIVFGGAGAVANEGAALYFDNNASRLTYIADGVAASATTANHVAGGYVTIAYDTDTAGQTAVAAVGNIKIEGGEAFIYA